MTNNHTRLTIGLLIDDLAGWGFGDYIQSSVVAGVADIATKHDANLLCFTAGNLDSLNEWVRGRNILYEFIDSNKVDGLIVLTTSIGLKVSNQRVLEKLEQYRGIPIVTIGDSFEEHYSVSIDNYRGMREALEHIIRHHNRRNIAFIKGSPGSREAETRFLAYKDVLKEHDIPYDERLVFQGNFMFESGARAITALNEQRIHYDAVVASNDNMAIGALTEILKIEGKLPEHMSVIGFDDIEPSEMLSLTTVKQSFYHEAQAASELLLRLLHGEDIPRHVEIDAPLVIRSSCGCMPSMMTELTYDYDSNVPNTALTTEVLKETFMSHMDQMVHATPELIEFEAYRSLRSELEQLPHALVQELFSEKEKMFFYMWRSIIFQAIQRKLDLTFMHNALSHMRVLTLNSVKGDASSTAKAENLFQMARIQISDAVQRMSHSHTYMSSLLSDQLEQLGEQLVTHLEIPRLKDVIAAEFPKYGIHEGYICLYEDPTNPLGTSRPMLAYRNHEQIDVDENSAVFPTIDLLPRDMLDRLKGYRHQFVVQTLHHINHNIGYALFSFDKEINKAYEVLRLRLSHSLRVSRLISDVKNHSLELERQVIARTRELSVLNEELQRQSIRDELTGLLNRRGFMQQGQEAFELAARKQYPLLLVYADLDNLKKINDIHGHAEGDFAIKMMGEVLEQSFSHADVISRLAGDEFTVIVANPGTGAVDQFQRTIQACSNRMNQLHDKPFLLSVSTGFAEYDPHQPCTFEKLMHLADEALYREKKRKKE